MLGEPDYKRPAMIMKMYRTEACGRKPEMVNPSASGTARRTYKRGYFISYWNV